MPSYLPIFAAKDVAGVPDGQRHCLITEEDREAFAFIAQRILPGKQVEGYVFWNVRGDMQMGDRADARTMKKLTEQRVERSHNGEVWLQVRPGVWVVGGTP